MALETSLGDLFKEEPIDTNKILSDLLNPKNIDMKTHIVSPLTFAILEGIINNIEGLLSEIGKEKIKLPLTKKLLKDIIKQLKHFLVSWNRLSREEITKTLQSIKAEGTEQRSLYQKLIGLGK